MKKVGIITTHYAINYGAILQAYSLVKTINELGYKCELIDYRPNRATYGRTYLKKGISLSNILRNLYLAVNFKKYIDYKKRRTAFDRLLKESGVLSSSIYRSYEDLSENLTEYDIFVCGSDQIWNPSIVYDKAYFLDFKSSYPHSKYIAYAPSIALDDLTKENRDIIASQLQHFDHISIREKQGKELISPLTEKPVFNAIDPVFLRGKEEWKSFASDRKICEPYIFCYFIGVNEEAKHSIKRLKKITGLKIVYLNVMVRNSIDHDFCIRDASPEDFVSLIYNAEIVCSNSFHATAFSILFQKQFFVQMNANNRNSRMLNLMELGHIEGRELTSENIDLLYKNQSNLVVNYEQVSINIGKQIELSRQYLIEALKGK